jgi:hypothetical protein
LLVFASRFGMNFYYFSVPKSAHNNQSYTFIHIHTYHSRFISEGVAEVSQMFFQDTHVLPKLVSWGTLQTPKPQRYGFIYVQYIIHVAYLKAYSIAYSKSTSNYAAVQHKATYSLVLRIWWRRDKKVELLSPTRDITIGQISLPNAWGA